MAKEIPLTKGRFAVVSDEDYPRVRSFLWYCSELRGDTYYAVGRPGTKRKQYMHRFLRRAGPGEIIDHRNGDGLDNRRRNTRRSTHSQNHANHRRQRNNTSGFTGVWWHAQRRKWSAEIKVNQKKINLGLFEDPITAAKARDRAAIKYFGSFAKLNIPKRRGGVTCLTK